MAIKIDIVSLRKPDGWEDSFCILREMKVRPDISSIIGLKLHGMEEPSLIASNLCSACDARPSSENRGIEPYIGEDNNYGVILKCIPRPGFRICIAFAENQKRANIPSLIKK